MLVIVSIPDHCLPVYLLLKVSYIFYSHLLRSEGRITKTSLFKYIENFTTKNLKFSDKNSDIFFIPAQNIEIRK